MISAIEKTGGVSTHSTSIIKELKNYEFAVHLYNTSPQKEYPQLVEYLIKGYKKTFGILIKGMRLKHKVSIVHLHWAGGFFGGLISAITISFVIKTLKNSQGNSKLVFTYHGITLIEKTGRLIRSSNPIEKFIGKAYEKMFKYVLENSDAFIVVSDRQRKIIIKYLGNKYNNKLSVIPNGFSSQLFYPLIDKNELKQKLNLPIDKKIILNVAYLSSVKGQRYLIEAMKYLVKYRKDILCIIIGDGMLRKDLKDQIKKLGLENYIKLDGSKPHDEIPLWMNTADLFVLPSLSEGNPTVMFESLGVGLPFVGTRVGGVPEIIISEYYGLLCDSANSKDLAENILIGLDKEWDREKILEYSQQFTWKNIAKEIVKIYVSCNKLN